MKQPKYFCDKCGAECKVRAETFYYRNKDGKPVKGYYATCPNAERRRWWSVSDGHIYNHHFAGYNPDNDGGPCDMGV